MILFLVSGKNLCVLKNINFARAQRKYWCFSLWIETFIPSKANKIITFQTYEIRNENLLHLNVVSELLAYNLTEEMNLFKGQYTLKRVQFGRGFSTKEVFLAFTLFRLSQLFWENYLYSNNIQSILLSNALYEFSSYIHWIWTHSGYIGSDGKLETQFKLATCYVHRVLGKLGYHSLPLPRINMPCRAELSIFNYVPRTTSDYMELVSQEYLIFERSWCLSLSWSK